VLGERLWRSQFGSDRSIIGRTIQLDGHSYEVLGVLPASLRLPIDYASRTTTELWVPLALGPPDPQERGNHGLNALARLRPGATLRQAQAEIDTITRAFMQRFPNQYDREFGLTLVPAPMEVFGDVRPALLVLLMAVGAVLLIACANVANLLLARSEARHKELAIRSVLGAGRSRIVRQLLTESMLLSSVGGALGAALAYALMRGLVALDPLKIPRVQDLSLDLRVLGFTAVISLVTGALFGVMPAIQISRADLQPALKEGGRDSRVNTGWLRHALVVAEVAASVALVAAAMLLARSFARLLAVDPGFNPAHVLTLRTSLPSTSYGNGAAMVRAFTEIGRGLRHSPGVAAAGAVTGLPLDSTRGDWGVVVEGDPGVGHIGRAADWQVVTPGYFEALGTPLRQGRTFTDADRADTLLVIVVNETMARTFWPGQNPIGRRLTMGSNDRWITVVGVVADVHHRGLDAQPRAEMYRPHAQFRYGAADSPAVSTMTWVLRTAADPRAAESDARAAVRAVDPGLGISDVATMADVLNDSTSDRRLDLLLFVLLGGLASALATVGVYGVVAYSVTQRTKEIGIRMAIGAQPADVMRMVLAEGARLAAAGVALGSALSLAGARLIRGLLFDVSATDPATYVGVAAGLVAVALVAAAHAERLGSNASRTPSPMKTSRVRESATTTNEEMPSHGACRLSLPCARRSPSDGEPTGMPKPRKSSDVSVVIEPPRMKGMNVSVATRALGRMCLKITRLSFMPRAFAAWTYSRLRARKNSARTTPTRLIQPNSTVMTRSHQKLGSTTLERMMRRKSVGMPDQISIKRCPRISTLPP
jgi:putative ABC transport system permease protein